MSDARRDGATTAPLAPPSPFRRGVGGEVSRTPHVRDARTVAASRRLRRNLTDTERLLWTGLRRDQLGTRFRRQHPVGRYIVAFYAPELRLAVEIDGGQHATNEARDAVRTGALVSGGVAVLRFWNNEVMENLSGVLTAVSTVMGYMRAHTSPLTPLRNGGGDASRDFGALYLRLSLPGTIV